MAQDEVSQSPKRGLQCVHRVIGLGKIFQSKNVTKNRVKVILTSPWPPSLHVWWNLMVLSDLGMGYWN
jgi:hypothetical protein